MLLVCLIAFAGCDTFDPSSPIPVYVAVDTFAVTTTPNEGSASNKITEGWFYANNEFLGSYTLPATIPVIAEGETEIVVFPGIRVNGIAAFPDIYPFYERHLATVQSIPADTVPVTPSTTYLATVAFPLIEDFEASNAFVDDLDGDSETALIPDTVDVFEGVKSGRIVLTAEHDFIEVASLPVLGNIPLTGAPVYLEMNYKTNVELGVGLVGQGPGVPPAKQVFVVLRPRDDWNKIYIELTDQIIASGLPGYQVLFVAVHDQLLETSEVFVDNVKLVIFQP